MNRIRKLVKEIDGGKRLRENLPEYQKILSDTYLEYSVMELTFSAYMLAEMILDETLDGSDEMDLYGDVMEQLRLCLDAGEQGEWDEVIGQLQKIRSRIMDIMEAFTSYTDRLFSYDYVLGRMKFRFNPEAAECKKAAAIMEKDFLSRIMIYLMGDGDASVKRERLQELMGLLPVYLTKNKFLEKVDGALSLYEGSDRESLESFIYMVRSVAMLHPVKPEVESAEPVQHFLEELGGVDFSALDSETYNDLVKRLDETSERILNLTDYYYALQKVVNCMYALCLVSRSHTEKPPHYAHCSEVLRRLAKGELWEEGLVKLEGKIEECVERAGYLEAVLFSVKDSYGDLLDELSLRREFEDYAIVSQLLSDSLFIHLGLDAKHEIVGKEELKRVSDELVSELEKQLSGMQKPLKRAVMAAVLERIPAEFANADQIGEYVRTNLFHCHDFSEKAVVMLELDEKMTEALEWRLQ